MAKAEDATRARISAVEEDGIRVVRVGPLGPGANNAYLIRDLGRSETVLVDMPVTDGILLEALGSEGPVTRIVATHWHPDHWMSHDEVRAATGAPVLVGDREINIPEERIDGRLADGDEVPAGAARLRVLHTPGHTPGSICLVLGRTLISGDTLFAGGPGRTWARGDLEVLLETIASRLLPLPEATRVFPGHGGPTTIGAERQGHQEYLKHPRPAGYFGDVAWSG